ncbi:hypothetical protein BJV85_001335 [Clostridium acetobutylicum]|uniref:Uncharacterized protein n=1 Tax=Clostridium acetobutylicum (strain ATCC 824 / DSM 792 / JCM 1419 / IAM 19013 / LMG 5710 / NBRC 13948 / NRRL B-527 / VKM B-1787 / 2291 / W) TaxID=272562 RepID=Q97G18_CLOAB|nr:MULTISPECIES: hypothetical protein [Clostridium]AAK80505.1 Hypothetical protein CA_C2554 [Clostridium acetobutylicum ATCC 824]AEI32428.1 hypothetical protein SMB_G2589 [Clostridium acetobutylicum DSM 1731]ADZ21604.1 Conserved hypothetical protein [Clostridium acetobutylicum EA 2018]AWV79077.1 hypothetical protein DK921_02985 [Clostridium acetobutylicum]MBC2394961.1 hypothetical protein [Clostridium acetobutylicum]
MPWYELEIQETKALIESDKTKRRNYGLRKIRVFWSLDMAFLVSYAF